MPADPGLELASLSGIAGIRVTTTKTIVSITDANVMDRVRYRVFARSSLCQMIVICFVSAR